MTASALGVIDQAGVYRAKDQRGVGIILIWVDSGPILVLRVLRLIFGAPACRIACVRGKYSASTPQSGRGLSDAPPGTGNTYYVNMRTNSAATLWSRARARSRLESPRAVSRRHTSSRPSLCTARNRTFECLLLDGRPFGISQQPPPNRRKRPSPWTTKRPAPWMMPCPRQRTPGPRRSRARSGRRTPSREPPPPRTREEARHPREPASPRLCAPAWRRRGWSRSLSSLLSRRPPMRQRVRLAVAPRIEQLCLHLSS